jgi:hypothetical protein
MPLVLSETPGLIEELSAPLLNAVVALASVVTFTANAPTTGFEELTVEVITSSSLLLEL